MCFPRDIVPKIESICCKYSIVGECVSSCPVKYILIALLLLSIQSCILLCHDFRFIAVFIRQQVIL